MPDGWGSPSQYLVLKGVRFRLRPGGDPQGARHQAAMVTGIAKRGKLARKRERFCA
ncbi:hypothetical protein MPNT_220019 [Candidatus Methylacidithermus pantelleriae]|uniref:Uncharacterized protein n=1 Tax=Candidatus Methylacidithermus pantelleriae TaxID=2744239 RepID=A0A8J2BMY5_9BACT|nr:hypothetical protein MPNT_220019 [Candidatus Methylacidithermus pantelleriae]